MSWWGFAKTCVNKRLVAKGRKIFFQPFPIIFPTRKINLFMAFYLSQGERRRKCEEGKWLVQQVWEIGSRPIGFNVLRFVPVAAASNNQISSGLDTEIIFTPAARRSIAKIKLSPLLRTERALIKFSTDPPLGDCLDITIRFHYLKFPLFNVYWNLKPDSNG